MAKNWEYKKLKEPFNIFPGGDIATKVVAVQLSRYHEGNGLAVILLYHDGGTEVVSTNLPDEVFMLGDGEFFFSDWGTHTTMAKRLIEVGLIELVDKPRIPCNWVMVPIARLNMDLLADWDGVLPGVVEPDGSEAEAVE